VVFSLEGARLASLAKKKPCVVRSLQGASLAYRRFSVRARGGVLIYPAQISSKKPSKEKNHPKLLGPPDQTSLIFRILKRCKLYTSLYRILKRYQLYYTFLEFNFFYKNEKKK
jgi:hypothetical protein